jgi:hypothetical protein
MLNNPLVLELARLWGARMASDVGQSAAERVEAMYLTALGRPPDADEEQAALAFLNDAQAASSGGDVDAWSELAHVLVNLKEFIFIP